MRHPTFRYYILEVLRYKDREVVILMNSDLASVIDPKYIPLCYLSAVVGYLLILGLAIAIYKKLKTNFKLSDLWERKVNLIILCSIIFVSAVVNLLAITTDIVAIFVLSQILEILFSSFCFNCVRYTFLYTSRKNNCWKY